MAEMQRNSVKRILGGRYEIEGRLAQGGMSTVYKATDPNLRRSVAIKLIHPHLSRDPEFVQRFEQEAAVVAQLRHPNIVQVYDFAHQDDVYYMVLEYVSGETLQARLKALNSVNRRLPLATSAQLIATLCDAVDFAHQHGMIHRDLKPANIMINRQGQPILMDFGVAKMMGETRFTSTGTVIGTALYMSPEQARGERPDERADIYSLGVTLFEMITGQPPFEGDSAVVILMKHVNEPVPDIRRLNGDVPEELIAVVEKALAKDPNQRFQTAAEMGAALRAIDLNHHARVSSGISRSAAVVSPPRTTSASGVRPAPARQGRDWFAWLLGAATLLILMLIVGGVLMFVAWRFARPLILAQEMNLPAADGMTHINGGIYLVGLDASDGEYSVPHQVQLGDFWIDQYEVMNLQYAEFVAKTGHQPPAGWPSGKMPPDQESYPVIGVSWDLAAAYCQWAHKRLPSEAEWEVTARGPQGLLYPWGNDEHAVALPRDGTYPVGSIPSNHSPFGVFDMAGNVWEWVGDTYSPVPEGERVLRGGGYGFLKDMAYRLHGDPHVPTMIASAGFRCAADQVSGGEGVIAQVAKAAALPPGVLFQDEFSDPASGWPIGEEDHYHFGYHPAAFYHLEVSAPNDSLTIFRGLNFGDFTAEIKALVDHTDTQTGDFRYGVAVRRSDERYYAFTISPRTQKWQALKHAPDGWQVLAEGSNDSIRGLTAADTLRVDATGSQFTFYINGQNVTQVSDSDYASGDVGFIVETFDESLVHIHYASLTVEEVVAPPGGFRSQDDFKDPTSGWPTLNQDNSHYGYHPPDYYHVEISRPNDSTTVFKDPSLSDVVVETQVFVDHTDTNSGNFRYGLAVRGAGGDQYYAFAVSPRAGTWYVLKHTPAGLEELATGTSNSLRGLSANDTLRVEARGSAFTFSINGQEVTHVTDSDYSSGQVGFFVETFDESLAHVHYDSLTIEEIK
jgi:formylglycine-generating enzyme required for sulfatase activity/tRNA A-37 threonylcarbamoyl transferase component Bud32